MAAACGGTGGEVGARQTPSAESSSRTVAVVAVGDSDATGVGDESAGGWVGRYGRLLHTRLGRHVTVENLAAEGQTSEELLDAVSHDDFVRHLIRTSDVVLVGVGGADLNAGDDALAAGSCAGRACYSDILAGFAKNMAAIASEIHGLAPRALLRAMSLPNAFPGAGPVLPPFATPGISRYQVVAERAAVCDAMHTAGGQCVDVVRAFNGSHATADAYAAGLMTKDPCCYPSPRGQQLIAELLLATGVPTSP
jgi:lysophospholipase L1-like esterase